MHVSFNACLHCERQRASYRPSEGPRKPMAYFPTYSWFFGSSVTLFGDLLPGVRWAEFKESVRRLRLRADEVRGGRRVISW